MLTGAQKGQGGYLTLGKLSIDSRFNLLPQSTDHIYWLNLDSRDDTSGDQIYGIIVLILLGRARGYIAQGRCLIKHSLLQ